MSFELNCEFRPIASERKYLMDYKNKYNNNLLFCKLFLGPVYMEGHPPSRVNFTERLFEKKVNPSDRVKSWLCSYNSARACSDRLSLTKLTRLGEPKCSYGEKLARLGG